jgi:hypothetical protein
VFVAGRATNPTSVVTIPTGSVLSAGCMCSVIFALTLLVAARMPRLAVVLRADDEALVLDLELRPGRVDGAGTVS